jgi:uncharacterized membrane protein
MTDMSEDARRTYAGGHKEFMIGALAGALAGGLIGLMFMGLGAGEGGPGLHIMAGAALGAAIGLFVGMLKARQKDGGI